MTVSEPSEVQGEVGRMASFSGYLSGRVYFPVRSGLRWEIWFSYQDQSPDPHSGATRWKASAVRYWTKINALRAANDLWHSFNDGVWCESGRAQSAHKGD